MPAQECGQCGGVSQAFQREQGPSVSTDFLGSPVSAWEGFCVSMHLLYPRQGDAFCLSPQLLLNRPQLPKGQAPPSPDTASSYL